MVMHPLVCECLAGCLAVAWSGVYVCVLRCCMMALCVCAIDIRSLRGGVPVWLAVVCDRWSGVHRCGTNSYVRDRQTKETTVINERGTHAISQYTRQTQHSTTANQSAPLLCLS